MVYNFEYDSGKGLIFMKCQEFYGNGISGFTQLLNHIKNTQNYYNLFPYFLNLIYYELTNLQFLIFIHFTLICTHFFF